MKTKEPEVIKAELYADSKVPILEEYHEWKKYKEAYLAGWRANDKERMKILNDLINDPYKSDK